ncbi:endonuclease/exonuclease/phosphatase family protein [Sansalvadorimonas sp. 2012CJ34-2]|uniref:Endonuclease/exonuclease/phosphatase family protein n=1 Tax=Parendozoicomonas callyspongiae TaxID=2942213 RepID=A0ABT0PGE0_9GAMM|nr:endonuclease/exonuclease/phosphatase family protein [Sansalvadorimonas sp. 2012CJ34-2]MCL6270301.1 endonuclease/exonuclease/phosphatase family protein [Sansalvadorimonas sp. 2012CJ34-2]
MPRPQISFATCNLYNLNEPGRPIYFDRDGLSEEEYSKKLVWLSRVLTHHSADIWGFQELWHGDSLQNAFAMSGLDEEYSLLVPYDHTGGRIVCGGAVKKKMLVGEPEWIDEFPEHFKLDSKGDDAQTPDISVQVNKFSRPVLHFKVKPRQDQPAIHIYVCHFKSKKPTSIRSENWYKKSMYSRHQAALGNAISTIRRTAESAALRMILTERLKKTDTPVIVMGDLNDSQHSNTLNILTDQPNYLLSHSSRGGSDSGLYSVGTLQEYRSLRDVYYTHVYKNTRESLDHILVSQEFYDNSRKRIWAFKGMDILNDHLNDENHKETGTTDHGIVRARFEFNPA